MIELLIFKGYPFKDHRACARSTVAHQTLTHATGDVRNGFKFEVRGLELPNMESSSYSIRGRIESNRIEIIHGGRGQAPPKYPAAISTLTRGRCSTMDQQYAS